MPGGDFHPWIFFILAFWILVCGLGVVVFKKVMYSAVSMVFCFLGVAFAYAALSAPLVAVVKPSRRTVASSDHGKLRRFSRPRFTRTASSPCDHHTFPS